MNYEIWTTLAEGAINFIVVNALTTSAQERTVADLKLDLRTTKEDLLAQIKEGQKNG